MAGRQAPRWFALALPAYLATFLAVDTQVDAQIQLGIGALSWALLLAVCIPLSTEQRARVAVVIVAATVAEVTGSLIWGVYTYRLENLPSFIPPGHGLVYLSGVALAEVFRPHLRILVGAAAIGAAGWGVAGLTVLPRLDVAGAMGVPLLLLFFWRGRNRGVYAGVFAVVAALELYGTAIGTWRWAEELPGLGIPDGNPPSGAASGYVCFDIVALALAGPLVRIVGTVRAAAVYHGRRMRGVPMRRKLTLAAAALALLVFPAGGEAKGPSDATIFGPGLGSPIDIDGDEGSGPLGALSMEGGLFAQMFDQTPDPTLPARPTGDLGPRYTVRYVVPGPENDTYHLRQDVYPYADGGPVTFLPAGTPIFQGMKTHGGWFRGTPSLLQTLVGIGLPEERPTGAGSDDTPFWQSPGGLAIWAAAGAALIAAGALAYRRRPGPAAA